MIRYGQDHDRYAWSMLQSRPPVTWPESKTLALWVNVSLQHFPLSPNGKPVKLPGNMVMPYPDLRHYTLRDHGNRVGVFRLLAELAGAGVTASWAVNAVLADRYPALLERIRDRGEEVVGHSWSMDTPHAGGVDPAVEADVVERSLDTLRQKGFLVRGWISPGRLQSPRTPELLKAQGVEWMADWVNDDLPYAFRTAGGDLWQLPLATEWEDRFTILDNQHSEQSWAEQVCDAADLLHAESLTSGGRIMTISLHPWVTGQAHRIRWVREVLDHVMALPGVWNAAPSQILDAWLPFGVAQVPIS